MAPEQISGGRSEGLPERAVWQLSRDADAPEDDETRFLDLAGYADGLLDDDERERITALVAGDAAAADDIAAARSLTSETAALNVVVADAIIARAQSLHPAAAAPKAAQIIQFRSTRRFRGGWQAAANWASLAAALLVASWLGFTLGTDASRDLGEIGQSSDDSVLLRELFDPSTGLLRDVTEGIHT
jgi:anti-sigma factor RsiW